MVSQKKYLGHSGRPCIFAISFAITIKLVQFFTSCECNRKYLVHSEKSRTFVTSFVIILKLSQRKYLGHSGRSRTFVTPFAIILKLVQYVITCEKSKKVFRTLREV